MTPLYQLMVRRALGKDKPLLFKDQVGILSDLNDIHCFEVTEVVGAALDLARDMTKSGMPCDVSEFLPADRTWIEGVKLPWMKYKGRSALLLEKTDNKNEVNVKFVCDLMTSDFGSVSIEYLPKDIFVQVYTPNDRTDMMPWLYAILAMINTPRVVDRVQHAPHKGLQRQCKNLFPLNSWVEVKLSCRHFYSTPEGEFTAHYTGEKCRHFVRSHIRIRRGKLEIVKAHERGNAKLGYKNKSYRITA